MYVAVSYCTTQFRALRRTWQYYESLKGNLKAFGTSREDEERCGGKVVILNWQAKRVEVSADVTRAAGLLQFGEFLLIGAYDKIVVSDWSLNVCDRVIDPRFNNIHGLAKTPQGIAVASTGIDTVLFLDNSLRVVGEWCAVTHGFDTDPGGRRRHVDLSQDHRRLMYPTLMHTTHVNSLLWVDRAGADVGRLYATLFHQGIVADITPGDGVSTVCDNLRAPHAVTRLRNGGFMVADSANNRMVKWYGDGKGEGVSLIDLPQCDWVQDGRELATSGTYLIADCNHCRLLEVDSAGNCLSEWSYDEDWKIQELLVIGELGTLL